MYYFFYRTTLILEGYSLRETTAYLKLIDLAQNMSKNIEKILKDRTDAGETRKVEYKKYLLARSEINLFLDEYAVNFGDTQDQNEIKKVIEKFDSMVNAIIADKSAIKNFDLDIYGPFIETFKGKMIDFVDNVYNHSDRDQELEYCSFIGENDAVLPGKLLVKNTCLLNAGINSIKDILQEVLPENRQINVMVSNLEYLTELSTLKNDIKKDIMLYATFSDNSSLITKDLRAHFERVAIGSTSSYIIKNNSMDVVIHRFRHSKIYHTYGTNVFMDSVCLKDIKRLYRYVRSGGLLLFQIPTYLLHNKECIELAKKFYFRGAIRIQQNIIKSDRLQYVTLILQKKEYSKINNDENEAIDREYQKLQAIQYDVDLETIKKNMPKSSFGTITMMSGEIPDLTVLELVLDESPLFKKRAKIKLNTSRPLLPFKKGQIGQVLASGHLDGIIDEGNGYKHVIRGRVYKGAVRKMSLTEDPENDNFYTRTTKTLFNNLVEINLFTGNGNFKRVAMTV